MAMTVGAAGTVPAAALDDTAGLASPLDAVAVLPACTRADVRLLAVTTPLTQIAPLVNGLVLFVHDICCPLGTPQTQPVPEAPTGSTPAGMVSVSVTGWFSVAPEELTSTL
jgi:hypothetical protein